MKTITTLLVAVAALLFTSVAWAQSLGAPDQITDQNIQTTPPDILPEFPAWDQNDAAMAPGQRPRVTFAAHGLGVANVRGKGIFFLEGRGQVMVHAASREHIKVRGFEFVGKEGKAFKFQGSGQLLVKGERAGISIRGYAHRLIAAAKGGAHLKGRGWWKTRDDRGQWTKQGTRVRFGA